MLFAVRSTVFALATQSYTRSEGTPRDCVSHVEEINHSDWLNKLMQTVTQIIIPFYISYAVARTIWTESSIVENLSNESSAEITKLQILCIIHSLNEVNLTVV